MKLSLQYSILDREDRGELLDFYASALDASERVSTLHEWRLRGAPASGGIGVFVARRGSRIVGATSAVPIDLCLGGATINAAWQQDTIVAHDHRGMGIGKQLVEVSSDSFEVVMGKGTLPAMYQLKRSVGFRDVPGSNYLIRPISLWSPAGSLRRRLGLPILYIAGKLRGQDHRRTTLSARPATGFSADFDPLCQLVAGGSEVSPLKNSAYLNWRYTLCPNREYRIIRVEEADGRLRGAAVLRPNIEPYTDAWLVDMIVGPNDDEARHALLNACIGSLRENKASLLRTFATSPSARRVLMARGFFETDDSPRFTYRFRTAMNAFQSAPWNFWHGDGDTELLD